MSALTQIVCFSLCWLAVDAFDRTRSYSEAINNGTYGSYPVRNYATEVELSSPRVNWLQWSPSCDDGRLHFITPRGERLDRPGPMILDGNGDLVWSQFFDNPFGGQAYDLKVQQYQGKDYLTFWLGNDAVRGHGAGVYYMLDSSYEIVHQVNAAGGFDADLHEFIVTPQGTALLTVYDVHYKNITYFRQFNATEDPDDAAPNYIWDCLIQEVSIDTGDLLFQWRVSDHIDLKETYRAVQDEGTKEIPWDWYHVNSIAKDETGNYLISARYTHSLIYIDGKTGEILWRLGGKRNSFMDLSDGFGLSFAWQHDARFHELDAFPEVYTPPPREKGVSRRLLTLFDNAVEESFSRGLLLELTFPTSRAANIGEVGYEEPEEVFDTVEKLLAINGTDAGFTVRLVQAYENPRRLRSSSQGSMQILTGEQTKVLVGYGFNAVWTEFDINGTVLCDVHYGAETSWESGHIQSYRSYKFDWIGKPKTSPKIEISDDDLELYMSWNGATEVAEWLVQDSDVDEEVDGDHWADVIRTSRRGFETSVEVPVHRIASRRWLRALALDQNGNVLDYGISELLDRSDGLSESSLTSVDIVASTSLNGFVVIVVGVAAMVFIYDLFKKWQSWRIGRPGAGPIRWRRGSIYSRLSGEA